MRLFTGIAIPPDILGSLSLLMDHLRPTAHLKWSPPYNLHLTTKFIGEWPEQKLDQLISELHKVPRQGPIPITVSGLGWFPNPHSPRVLWAAGHAPETLQMLAAAIDRVLQPLGIPAETKKFSPHLTLARIKDVVPLAEIQRAIAALTSVDFGTFTAQSFHLYLSKPGPSGSIYTQLADFPLINS